MIVREFVIGCFNADVELAPALEDRSVLRLENVDLRRRIVGGTAQVGLLLRVRAGGGEKRSESAKNVTAHGYPPRLYIAAFNHKLLFPESSFFASAVCSPS